MSQRLIILSTEAIDRLEQLGGYPSKIRIELTELADFIAEAGDGERTATVVKSRRTPAGVVSVQELAVGVASNLFLDKSQPGKPGTATEEDASAAGDQPVPGSSTLRAPFRRSMTLEGNFTVVDATDRIVCELGNGGASYDDADLVVAALSAWCRGTADRQPSPLDDYHRPSVLFRPSIGRDGNKWCALYGENLMDGVAGFGDTPELAMLDFDENFREERIKPNAAVPPSGKAASPRTEENREHRDGFSAGLSLAAAVQQAGGSVAAVARGLMDMTVAEFVFEVVGCNGVRFHHDPEAVRKPNTAKE